MKELTLRMQTIEAEIQAMRKAGRQDMEYLKYDRLLSEWDSLKAEREKLKINI